MEPKNGSATIMILLLLIGITIMAMTLLKNTIAFYELALERMEHIRQEKALEALVMYGIAVRFIHEEKQEDRTYEFDTWPPPYGAYQGIVTIREGDLVRKITAQLVQNNNVLRVTEIVIAKNE